MAEVPNFRRRLVLLDGMKDFVRSKWNDDVLLEGFIPFPKRLLRTMERILPKDEGLELLTAILAIADFRGSSRTGAPSLHYLAFIADVPAEEFANRLQRLEELGLLSIRPAADRLLIDPTPLFAKIQSLIEHDQ